MQESLTAQREAHTVTGLCGMRLMEGTGSLSHPALAPEAATPSGDLGRIAHLIYAALLLFLSSLPFSSHLLAQM